ncbi:MAG: outer membrane protein assembly factor BamA [Vicinamibacterales bacterium]
MRSTWIVASVLACVMWPGAVAAQGAAETAAAGTAPTLCGQPVPRPASLPPAGSGPVLLAMGVCFDAQGNTSVLEPQAYLFHIRLRPSRPSAGQWVAWDAAAEATAIEDFRRLWDTGFLTDLSIETADYVLPNGTVGTLVTFHLEERDRIKLLSYDGSDVLPRSEIDKALAERGIQVRLDSFLDERAVGRVEGALRTLMADRGYAAARVSHVIVPVAGSPKTVQLTFTIDDGPRTAIRDVQVLGNRAFDDDTLGGLLTGNRPYNLLSRFNGTGRFREDAYDEDATRLESFYKDHGYIGVRVGRPDLRVLEDSPDGRTRWVQLRVPVVEGRRYRLGELSFEGNTLVDQAVLREMIGLESGAWYSESAIRKGLDKARDLYGSGGYMEFTAYPDLTPRPVDGPGGDAANAYGPDPVVDVVLHVTEGPRYTVNRITVTGNTTTRDGVVRREMQLVEGGVFNTEALKSSVRRINQLGFFKPIEGSDTDLVVEKAADTEHAVDVTLKVEEQNRNQVQFGAGVSQYEGIFGNVSFTTANFLGRGESLSLTGQRGSRSSAYQLAFSKPYVFDRPMNAGFDLYSRKVNYLTGVDTIGYSEVRSGIDLTVGRALFQYSRLFLTYGYEVIDTAVSSTLLDALDTQASVGVPVFNTLLDEGRHVESRITPSFVYNTVDHPLVPRRGQRLSLRLPVAGGALGGTANYVKPEVEAIWYLPHTARTGFGVRANAGWLLPYGHTHALPYYLRYFLGGENQIRGVDIRTVGPTDANNRAIGGDKFVLFNAEYYFDIAGPVRAVLFHDAGQAFSETEALDLRRLRTSSGLELRIVMPMLNVPFRLIYAWNVYRDTFQPSRSFRFAVGTTF